MEKEYRDWWTCRYQSSWLSLADSESPLSSHMPDLNGVKEVGRTTRTGHSGFKAFKGCDSYSTFQISCLPRLEQHIAWAAVTRLTFSFPMCLLSLGSGRILFCLKMKSKLAACPPNLIWNKRILVSLCCCGFLFEYFRLCYLSVRVLTKRICRWP